MIKFKKLSWSNAFSYGADNVIQLDDCALTQLIGKNGNGKSSIALILEEVLFNTNSKKIKKGDILNRYTDSKNYVISIDFDIDGRSYVVSTTRSNTTSTVKFTCDGIDISSHTATGTYKQIEATLGIDHKAFSQLVYQSSVSSLEFLTATDTARKKFLIELLNLGVYTKACDTFKEQASEASKALDIQQAKAATVKSWLTKYAKEDLTLHELEEELSAPVSILAQITEFKNNLANIERTNKDIVQSNKLITQNNTYIQILSGLVVLDKPETPKDTAYLVDLQAQVLTRQKSLADGKTLSTTTAMSTCKTCNQAIDNSIKYKIAQDFLASRSVLEEEIASLEARINTHKLRVKEYTKYKDSVAEYEKYTGLVDKSLPIALALPLDADELRSDIKSLEASAKAINDSIERTRSKNKAGEAHNAKVAVIEGQMAEMNAELKVLNVTISDMTKELTTLQVLVKAFSTSGLVAYKIECLVKDLESLTNEYLSTLAAGRFQLSFKITSSDKLNVVITDNGVDIDICALSSGERARVNVATLLAIRKLMQTLSNSRTNLLILDETVENLDADGKEKLIEVLLEETDLNTFLISHGFSHPLLEKVNIVKENNISRIEV